mgnify:CR=1 FL=1
MNRNDIYPNNVLSLGTGPAKHLPCGADDAYLEELDRREKEPGMPPTLEQRYKIYVDAMVSRGLPYKTFDQWLNS